MTREAEIKRASINHLYQYDYSQEEGECIYFYIKEFTEGANWADENPNIWHDVSEIPNNHKHIMFMPDPYTIKTSYIPDCLEHCRLNNDTWNKFIKDMNITKWAYVKDLLPKENKK